MTRTQQLQQEIKKTADDALSLVKTTTETAQKGLSDVAKDVSGSAQKIFSAGLGALAVAGEEGSNFFNKLVARGEKVDLSTLEPEQLKKLRARLDGDAEKTADAVKGRVKDARFMAEEASDKFEARVQEAVARVMKGLGVPTREEIAELAASVDRLTKQIARLKAGSAPVDTDLRMESVGGGWYEIKQADTVIEKVQGKDEATAKFERLASQKA